MCGIAVAGGWQSNGAVHGEVRASFLGRSAGKRTTEGDGGVGGGRAAEVRIRGPCRRSGGEVWS